MGEYKDKDKRREYAREWEKNKRAAATPEQRAAANTARVKRRKLQHASDPSSKRSYHLKNTLARYGLTVQTYEELRNSQNDLCALCEEPLAANGGKPVIDHDHCTGKVRGVIHHRCNVAIGFLLDDPERCRKAAAYLERLAA